MRVLFVSTQGAGHFAPMVAFIDGCRGAGHEVLVAAPPSLRETIEGAGHPYWPGADPPADELGAVWGRVPAAGAEEAQWLVVGEIFARLNVDAMLPSVQAACDEFAPDVILHDTAAYVAPLAAELNGIACARIATSLASAEQAMLAVAGPALEARRPGLGDAVAESPFLSLFPESLEDPDVPGPARTHRFRAPVGERPQPLGDWWPGDERPLVYITFGSVVGQLPIAAAIYSAAVEAASEIPARVLLTTGRGVADDLLGSVPGHVHVEEWVPQADVLAQADVVVSHGGSGTTLGCLAAGRPMVVTPLFADQPYNARRVDAAGAGIGVGFDRAPEGAFRTLEMGELRDALERVLDDPGYGQVAQRMAQEMRALPPAADALALF